MSGGLSFTSRDLAGIAATDQRAALYAARADTDAVAARVAAIHQTHPHLAAPVVMSLAESKAPDDVVTRAAELQVKKDAREAGGTWWGNALSKVLAGAQKGVPAPGFIKAGVRTALNVANYPVELAQAGVRDVIGAAQGAGRFATELATNPTGSRAGTSATPAARPALTGGAAPIIATNTGVTPTTDPNQGLASQLSGQTRLGSSFQLADETRGSTWDKAKMLVNSSTNLPPTPVDGDPAATLEQAGQSWFPGINSLAEKRQVANARDASMTGGHVTTFGRASASIVGLEPGTFAYNMLSGTLDVPIYAADPTAYVGGVLAKAGKARRVLGGDGKVVESSVTDLSRVAATAAGETTAPVARDIRAAWEGGPTLYAGTSRRFAGDAVNPDPFVGSGAKNLFGFGFYSTDSEGVARSYMGKGAARPGRTTPPKYDAHGAEIPGSRTAIAEDEKALYNVRWQGSAPPKVLDLDRSRNATVRNWVLSNQMSVDATDEAVDALHAATKGTDAKLLLEFRKYLASSGEVTSSQADEIFADLADTLSTQGIDVLQHTGGIYAGSGDSLHKVSIFLDPAKIGVGNVTPTPFVGGAPAVPGFLVESPRKTVIFEDAARQLEADDMRPTWEGMAKTRGGSVPVYDDAGQVTGFHDPTGYGGDFDRLRRSQPNMPVEALLKILDEPTPEGVRNIIGQGMARDFMDTPLGKVANPNSARYTRPKPRLLHNRVSEPVMSRADPNGSLDQFDRWQNVLRKGAGKDVFTPAVISANNEAMARELTSAVGNPAAVPVAVTKTLKATLVAHGIEPGKANQVLEIYTNAATAERHFAVDGATGADRHLKTVVIDGLEHQAPSPHLSAEMFDESFTLPAAAPILRALSVARRVTATAGWEDVVAFGDMFNMAFKTGALGLRPVAFALRNVMEAQARVATDGLDGIYNSPASLTAWLAGHDRSSKFSRAVAKAGVPVRGAGDLVDDDLLKAATEAADATVFGRTLEAGAGPYADPKAVLTGNHTVVRRSAGDVWLEAHRFQLAKLASSPEVRMVARHGATPQTKQWFWETGLRQKMATRRPELLDRQGADKYLDGIAADLVTDYGKNPKLIQAIAHNTLDDIPLNVRDPATGRLKPGKGIIKALRDMEGDLPEFAVSAQVMDASRGTGPLVKGAAGMERMLERVMEFSGTKPDNFFDRSPVFRQILWNNILRTAPLADPGEKAAIVARARSNHLPTAFVKKLEATEFRGTLTRKEVNELASVRARRDTLKLLYDSHDQQNWTTTLRMVQPFAAAMQDQYRVWSKLLAKNPLVLHRVEQGWHAGHQSGFLYADPNTGQERFMMPGSRAFAQLLGLPPDAMSGSTTQANLITSGLVPGFGPGVSTPASAMIPDDPAWDPVRQLFAPYGPEDGGLVGRLGPSYLDKATVAIAAWTGHDAGITPKQRRMLLNTVSDAHKYLASTGDYDQSDPADMQRLNKDARRKGAQMLLLRALVQANAPASPSYDVMMKDKDGKLTSTLWMASKYRKFIADDKREGTDTADYKMLSTYGETSFYAFTGNTQGVSGGASEAMRELVIGHPEVEESFPDVWGLFTDPDSPFSFEEYNRQMERGGGKVGPKEVQVKAQTGMAWATYRQYVAQVGPFPDKAQRDWKAMVKEKIRAEFPLWDDSFDASKSKRAVEQVRAAVTSPALKDTDAAKGAAIYLTYRDQLVKADQDAYKAGASSYKTPFRAKDAAAQRVWLRQVAQKVTQQHPGFAPLFEKVFDREMIDDTENQESETP